MKNTNESPNGENLSAPKSGYKGAMYKFRAECSSDATLVRIALAAWVIGWHERQDSLLADGSGWFDSDVAVEMELLKSAPDLNGLLWIIQRFVDCHVIADTLEPTRKYTGHRIYEQRKGVRPSENDILLAGRALRRVPDVFKQRAIRARDAVASLTASHQP